MPLFLSMLRSETAASPERMERALRGLRGYQEAWREKPPAPMPALAERYGAALRDYGGNGPDVLFVPSLINPPNILDLGPDKSLLRWLAGRGHRVLLLDWGWDVAARTALSVTGHVEEILVPLASTPERPPALVGYCLGGTMALAAAPLVGAPALATIAAPWHFGGFTEDSRRMLAALWSGSKGAAGRLGMLPMEALQSAFWSLDPSRTVTKFERFAELDPAGPEARAFIALEDWSNDGPPVPHAAASELFDDLFGRDLPGSGAWVVGGRTATAGATPLLNIVSTSDRIVPATSAPRSGERIELSLGHVGMVVGSRARGALWEPLDRWLSQARPSC